MWLSLFALLFLLSVVASPAEGVVILYENYDSGTPGSPVPGWDPGVFFTQDAVYQGAGAARINSDFERTRPFGLTFGIIEVDLMMRPNDGSNTNMGLLIQGDFRIVKSEPQHDWRHLTSGGAAVHDRDYVEDWYRIVYRVNTLTNKFDLYLGRAGEFLVQLEDEALYRGDLSGGLSEIGLISGRGGAGTDSYFDEMRISLINPGPGGSIPNLSATFVSAPGAPVPEPSTLLLLASGLAGLGAVARRRRRPE